MDPTVAADAEQQGEDAGGDILLKTDLDVGHFSASDRYKYLWEKAFEQAFVLDKLEIQD